MNEKAEMAIVDGCSPVVALAIFDFNTRWRDNATDEAVRALFKRIIEPAVSLYFLSLPTDHFRLPPLSDTPINDLVEQNGFRFIEALLLKAHRLCRNLEIGVDKNFLPTLEALREVIIKCALHHSPTLPGGLRNRFYQELCEFCGDQTEYASHWKLHRAKDHDQHSGGRSPGLSVKYCPEHRPEFLDGASNSKYLLADRNSKKFAEELARLSHRSTSKRRIHLSPDLDPYVDAFYHNVLAFDAIYPEEESVLRNEVRRLADKGINDKKKRIVMLRASGYTHAEIANVVGIKSRQAISKVLGNIPMDYRFDLKEQARYSRNCPYNGQIEGGQNTYFPEAEASYFQYLSNLFGEDLSPLLLDPNVVEMILDPDGSLWKITHTLGWQKIQYLATVKANQIIHSIAHLLKIESDQDMTLIEAHIPFTNIRFMSILPPISTGPAFVIAKKACTVYCPTIQAT